MRKKTIQKKARRHKKYYSLGKKNRMDYNTKMIKKWSHKKIEWFDLLDMLKEDLDSRSQVWPKLPST